MGFRYAICNELYHDRSHEEAFSHAASLGYQGIEIAPFTLNHDVRKITTSQRSDIVRLAEKNGVEIIGLHWLLAHTSGFHLTSPDGAVRRATAEYLIELSHLCRDLGGKVMVFGSPAQRNLGEGITREQADQYAIEVFESVIPSLEKSGVTLALEPLGPEEGNYLLTAAEGIELIQKIDSPNVQLHLDVKAMSTEPRPIPEIIEDSLEYTVHFHANDPNRRGPGMGDVDFQPIFAELQKGDYCGWISVEVFDYEPGIETLSRESIQYMQQIESGLAI